MNILNWLLVILMIANIIAGFVLGTPPIVNALGWGLAALYYILWVLKC